MSAEQNDTGNGASAEDRMFVEQATLRPRAEHEEELTDGRRCQGCEDAPLGQHTGPHDWEGTT